MYYNSTTVKCKHKTVKNMHGWNYSHGKLYKKVKKKKSKIENRKSIDISSYKHSLLGFKIGHSSEVGKSFMLNEIV